MISFLTVQSMNSVGKAVLISDMLTEVKPDLACLVETSSILPQFDFFDVCCLVAKGNGVKKRRWCLGFCSTRYGFRVC